MTKDEMQAKIAHLQSQVDALLYDNTRLTLIVHGQAKLLANAEPSGIINKKPKGATQ